jgi:hypothetical protein
VTEPRNVLLDREQLERAFTALGNGLMRRGVVADIFIVCDHDAPCEPVAEAAKSILDARPVE